MVVRKGGPPGLLCLRTAHKTDWADGSAYLSIREQIALLLLVLPVTLNGQQQSPSPKTLLVVKLISGQELKVGPEDFAKLPPVHVSATDHGGEKHEYEGVHLRDLLTQVGVAKGASLRGKELGNYVLAEAADGYRVLFSLAELDPDFTGTQVVVTLKVDGQPLTPGDGPVRLVVPGDKRQARWVRMLTTISIMRAQMRPAVPHGGHPGGDRFKPPVGLSGVVLPKKQEAGQVRPALA